MGRNIIFSPEEYYHLYNRGTDKRDIFHDVYDYGRFQSLLYMANSKVAVDLKLQGRTLYELMDIDREGTLVDICAYVLMPNHYHILARNTSECGISDFMRKLGTAYTMYFNAKNERNGALFQGAFKAKHVDSDEYLQYLLSYIHLNPVKLIDATWKETGITDKQKAEAYLERYAYSSFIDYLGTKRVESNILNHTAFPSELTDKTDFQSAVSYWLQGSTL